MIAKNIKVYLVGAGAGGLENLTIKAYKLITKEADVVIYDRLISDDILAEINPNAEKIFAGKEPDLHHKTQDEINDLIVESANRGKIVVRLKGGDPFIFGRGGEEIEFLKQNNIESEVIPGISAAQLVASKFKIPTTFRKLADGVIYISGHNYKNEIPDLDYEYLAKTNNTIVIYMGVGNSEIISQKLIENGADENLSVAVIQEVGMKNEKVIYSNLQNLSIDIKSQNISNPAIIIIGEVVKKSLEFNS